MDQIPPLPVPWFAALLWEQSSLSFMLFIIVWTPWSEIQLWDGFGGVSSQPQALPPLPSLAAVVGVSPLLYSVRNFLKTCRDFIISESSSALPNGVWKKPEFSKGYGRACQPRCLQKPGCKRGAKPAQNQKSAHLLITITIKLGH